MVQPHATGSRYTFNMARNATTVGGWVRRALNEAPLRSKSLIVTIFGDSILPYSSGLWLSELIQLLEPFGVNAQLTRTSAFRLAEEGWLATQREGRRSRYALTSSGRERVENASQRIYVEPTKAWDGNWTIVILSKSQNTVSARLQLRRELEWEGFGLLAPGIMIHPSAAPESVSRTLAQINLLQEVVVLQAHDLEGLASRSVSTLAQECWNCDLVAERYTAFIKSFGTVLPVLKANQDGALAFVVQTLLVHHFRRAVLHDPRLPAVLLPASWPGHAAFDLCRAVYRETYEQTRDYLSGQLEEPLQVKTPASLALLGRFGGLE